MKDRIKITLEVDTDIWDYSGKVEVEKLINNVRTALKSYADYGYGDDGKIDVKKVHLLEYKILKKGDEGYDRITKKDNNKPAKT